jgi:hypothetical protein
MLGMVAQRLRRLTFALACGIGLIGMGLAPAVADDTTPASSAGVARDWSRYPAIAQISGIKSDIYAVGDIHGDYDKAVKLLAAAHLIAGVPSDPKSVEWTGGQNYLVCTGDMIDKGPKSVEVLELMRALQASAQKQSTGTSAGGGGVVVALGNHETEFLASGSKAKKGDFYTELEARGISPDDVAQGRDADGLGAWLRNRPIAAKLNTWFFCHAGDTFGMSVSEIESGVERGIAKDGFGTKLVATTNGIVQAPMGGVPWWLMADAAGTTMPASPVANAPSGAVRLHAYAAALGCEHLVVGHHPTKVKFSETIERPAGEPFAYDGVLFLIDTGMSRGVQDGKAILLHIHTGPSESATAFDESGKETPLWSR